ncbi:hypothetical protein ACFVP8_03540 [Viridibacillus arvi]|uniref:hypothetical protein n=1 Tax=Viridibacillus arvi TaxID=263475 RepID=UPI0036BBB2B9
MKKTFNKLDKIQIDIAIIASLLVILGFTYDNLTEIAFILIAIHLLVNERNLRKDKKSSFSYLIIVMAILIIFLSILQLLN